MTMIAERLMTQSSAPGLLEISASGWFTYDWNTKEFGVDTVPYDTSLGSKLGKAIMSGLELHDAVHPADAAQRAPSDIDAIFDDDDQMMELATTSPRTFYEALHYARSVKVAPEIRFMLDEIMKDLVDFTHELALEGFGNPDEYSEHRAA